VAGAWPPSPPAIPHQRVTLARIVRARGRVGEVAAEILTDFPERLLHLRQVFLAAPDGGVRYASVRACWLHKVQVVFHFEGVESISDAEKLAGCLVQVPLAERVELPAGKHYITDLIGCRVWERPGTGAPASAPMGQVQDVQTDTGTPLLVVETPRGELLIPLAEEICTKIDTAARRIEVVLPEGLRELNQPGESSGRHSA
jgi:16S rRNA processing protein RimM